MQGWKAEYYPIIVLDDGVHGDAYHADGRALDTLDRRAEGKAVTRRRLFGLSIQVRKPGRMTD